MSSLKRQRSWHEDFTRNFLRMFSRSKSLEQDRTDTEPENGDEKDGSSAGQSDESGSLSSPEHHLTNEPTSQTLECLEQDRLVEGDNVCYPQGSVQGDAECDPPPLTPSALEPSSPPPPVDGFFRRLGSLFLFGRAEPEGPEQQSQSGTESEAQGTEDAQHTDPKTLSTGETEPQTTVEGVVQLVKPQELSWSLELPHCVADPEVKTTLQSEQDPQLLKEAQVEEDGEGSVESPSSNEEQERRRALACPPVVTHVTYRGLREIRKMRRKQEVRLHSPISEGEEGQRGLGVYLSASEEEETQPSGISTGSSFVAASTENQEVQLCTETSSSSDLIKSGHQSHDLPCSSITLSITHIPCEGTCSALNQSALQTRMLAKTQPVVLELNSTLTTNTSDCREKVSLEAVTLNDEPEASVTGSALLEIVSDHEIQTQSYLVDALMAPLTAQALEISNMQESDTDTDTATNSNTHLTDISTAPTSHTCFIGSDIDSNCCQESQLSGFTLVPWENRDHGSSEAKISGHAAWKAELVLEDEATQLGLAEEQSGLDEETLQLESKKMVDDILKSALAALERIDASERESETPLSDELNESAESLMLMAARDNVDASASLEQMFQEHLPLQADGSSQLNLSDDALGGRAQTDGSRSTPSSGYESIAGSDTDIRSMAMNSDSSSSGLIGAHCTEPELREKAGFGCCTEEGNPVCESSGRGSLHSTFLLGPNLEEREGPARAEANNGLLFKYDLSESNINHRTNITSAQPSISESLSGVNKGQVQCALEEHEIHVYVAQREHEDIEPQYVAKVNTESNNNGLALGLDSGDASPIINYVDLNQVQSINKSLFPNTVRNLNSELPHDSSGNEDRPNLSVTQSHVSNETTASHSVSGEALKKLELASQGPYTGHNQGLCNTSSNGESSFSLVKTYLATVVEDGQDSEIEMRQTSSAGPEVTHLGNFCSSADFSESYSAVKVVICSDTDDQSQDHEAGSSSESSLQSVGRLASLPVSVRAHLDIPGTSGRPLATDILQGPRGFTIISEEEELDTVFVNDTGPILSPNTRRAKAYPFSLSPIYEEDGGREDASREDTLHVPPATEEEQRSMEQQASSILSLLQSVSERLQSSAFSGSEDDEEKPEELEEPQHFLRPLWERYDNDSATADEESDLLLQKQITGISIFSEECEPATERGAPSNPSQEQKTTTGIQDGESGAKHHRTTLNDTNNFVKTANTPFYEYLKSRIVPSLNTEKLGNKSVLCKNDGSPESTTVADIGTFGRVGPRPTLLHIYEGTMLSRKRREVCSDMVDVKQVLFPQEATVHARRGCWLLYVEPEFRGSCVVLEEGQTVQTNGVTTEEDKPSVQTTLPVGSIRRAVKDDSVPEIHLHSGNTLERELVCLHSEADHIDAHGPVHLSDLSVHSGCWLAYENASFKGNHMVLEAGGLTTPILQNSPISCVRSLRPVRMGGLRVQRPLDPKMMLFEKPLFQGQCKELLVNTPCLGDEVELARVSSLQVTGGVWVGYSCENYRGQQCVLEEGEYRDCSILFSEPGLTLRSCRFLQADFLEPQVSLKSSVGEKQMEFIDQDVADLQQNGLMKETDAVHVKTGVWVAYNGRYYTGEQCVLERGQHPGALDWGGKQSSPLSIRPVRRELCREEDPKFLIRAYSKPYFAGESREFESEVTGCGSLSPTSFRVILGSWLLYDEEDYCGNQFVLGEGLYPDLISCGYMGTAIKSFKPIPYSFSEPFISLFSLSMFEGLETMADTPMETMDNFFTQSLRVNSGLWVVYEFGQFKGRQMLLQTGEYPCWAECSGWDTIGSLQPLRQRRMYLQMRSRALGMALTAERSMGTSSPAKLSMRPVDRSLDTQHWLYSQAMLKSKVGNGCLSVIGGKACVGARVALWEQHGRIHQRWNLNENGTISSHLNHSLVLDRKGGSGVDRDHLILSEFCADNVTQYWDIEGL